MIFDGSPSWTIIRWYGSKNGLHISKKSRFRIVGITMSSSSFKRGMALVEGSAIGYRERFRGCKRERERERRELRD